MFCGTSGLSVRGRMHLAATILPFEMMTAPSWSGEFLKNSEPNNRAVIAQSRCSPVLIMLSMFEWLGNTMSAPVLSFANSVQAFTISGMLRFSDDSLMTLRKILSTEKNFDMDDLSPTSRRNFLISC